MVIFMQMVLLQFFGLQKNLQMEQLSAIQFTKNKIIFFENALNIENGISVRCVKED
jgi:hypothetical protein